MFDEHEGWVKIYRKIVDHEYFKGDWASMSLFIYLLLEANWKDGQKVIGWLGRPIKRGETAFGTLQLSKRSGFGRQVIRTRLKRLVEAHIIVIKSNQGSNQPSNQAGSVATILNYDSYQDVLSAPNQPSNQPSNQLLTTSKESKEKKKKIYKKEKSFDDSHPFAEIFRELSNTKLYQDVFDVHKDDAHIKNLLARYSLTNEEMKNIVFDLQIWLDDGNKSKSPRSTLNTFCKRYRKSEPKLEIVKNNHLENHLI